MSAVRASLNMAGAAAEQKVCAAVHPLYLAHTNFNHLQENVGAYNGHLLPRKTR